MRCPVYLLGVCTLGTNSQYTERAGSRFHVCQRKPVPKEKLPQVPICFEAAESEMVIKWAIHGLGKQGEEAQ